MEGATERPSGNDRVSKHTSIGETKRETVEPKERERRFDSETEVEEQRYNITVRSVTHGTPRVLLTGQCIYPKFFAQYVHIYIHVKI